MKSKHFYVMSIVIIALMIAFPVGRYFAGSQMPGPIRTLSNGEWLDLIGSGHRVGPDSAPVTIVEFSDFLCTHCREFAETVELYKKDNPGKIKMIYHNFPLPQHQYSVKLAASAECVGQVGDYEKYYSLLYQNQDQITSVSLDSLARKAGVKDLKAFKGCMTDSGVMKKINRDKQLGMKIGLMQTPTIVINKVMYSGALSYQELSQAVDYAIQSESK